VGALGASQVLVAREVVRMRRGGFTDSVVAIESGSCVSGLAIARELAAERAARAPGPRRRSPVSVASWATSPRGLRVVIAPGVCVADVLVEGGASEER
jgi:hypothetical protein